MNHNKIVPSLWFHTGGGQLSPVLSYYKTIFEDNLQAGAIVPLGATPGGNTEMCEVTIFEQKYKWLSTAEKHHAFNDAVSFAINCRDQSEIDKFWNYFTTEGEEAPCGWCKDKFGLRWQVLPENLGTLMSKPNSFQVMLKQKKIIIEEYLK